MRTTLFALAGILMLMTAPAIARPQYALKEQKPCGYCHENPRGGGPRNKRGQYFQANNFSFKGYDELKVMGRFSPPQFQIGWKETLPKTVQKIGVGDTVGDGHLRLVLLGAESSETRSITVRKWDGMAWKTELSAEAPGAENRLAVGKYADGKAAVIVVSNALWYWDGGAYKMRKASHPLNILGTEILKDGSERLVLRDGDSVKLHRVDLSAGENWLSPGVDPPPPTEATFAEMKAPTQELLAIGMPDQLAAGGVIGLWDARKADALFFYGVQFVAQVESRSGDEPVSDVQKAAQNLVLKGKDVFLIIVDPRAPGFRPLWRSDRLNGSVLDVTLHDPRTGARGLTVLTDSAEGGEGRTLYFFQLL